MHRTYARARKAWKKAARTGAPRDYHEWRKRVKYHGHHLRLVRALCAAELADKIDPIRALDDLLGEMHDLAVLESWLARIDAAEHRAAIDVIRALSARKHILLEMRALAKGRSLFEAKPKRALRATPQAPSALRPRSHAAPDPGSV
jgi:CHAD domain-containing protein